MRLPILICCISLLFASCETTEQKEENTKISTEYFKMSGNTQGTTYNITYLNPKGMVMQQAVDSILTAYHEQLSTDKEYSIISKVNSSTDHVINLKDYGRSDEFMGCFNRAKEVYYRTNGSFNPALYPIVNYWGFFDGTQQKDMSLKAIESSLLLTNFGEEYFNLKDNTLSKKFNNAQLDFNAIAQGHSVDVIANFFDSKGIENYMIEIGGEVTCNGVNQDGKLWSIGIDKPIENSVPGEDLEFIANLENMSLATSGNYRKFYEIDGKKFSHTINPVTGSPVQHNLLSVTVISKSCADADAYATAFMVMGLLNAMNFVNNNPDLELNAYFVFDANGEMNSSMTKGFEKYIKK